MTNNSTPTFPASDATGWVYIALPSELASVAKANQQVCQALSDAGVSEDDMFAVKLSLEEALANAVKHGNRLDRNKKVTLRYRVTPQQVALIVADEGPGFQPEAVPDPTADENLEVPHGRGIMLMRAYMDYVAYERRGTEVHLLKELV